MAIHFRSVNEENKEFQILHLNAVIMYLVSTGYIGEVHVPLDAYDKEGEVYIHQIKPETQDDELKRKALYDEAVAAPDSDMPPYEELVEFDDIIPLKAEYTMGIDDEGKSVMVFKEVAPLELDEQLAYDPEGNLVLASELDEDDDAEKGNG